MTTLLVGLPLTKAQELIAEHAEWSQMEVCVVETAPPFVPRFRRPIWGERRVLRALTTNSTLELIVARELLGEDILTKETAPV